MSTQKSLPGVPNADQWGKLGTRRLVTIQHCDIGRLESEVIPLPRNGGLVVLTGRGPAKDPTRPAGSNGASKTTLAAAIDLLNLSHSWGPRSGRIHRAAPGLVFAPEDSIYRADVGWIIGTYRSDHDPNPVTVICRIKREGDDKLRYRVMSGAHNAEGSSHAARCEDAKRLWASADSPPLTVERYLDEWLGNHPRSTGYVNKRGSMQAEDKSIFTTELTKVSRVQVAADLIELAGLSKDIADEQLSRALVDENAAKVNEAVRKHTQVAAEVQARLDTYDRNAEALRLLDGAASDRGAWEVSRLIGDISKAQATAKTRDALLHAETTMTLRAAVDNLAERVELLSDTAKLKAAVKDASATRAAAQSRWDRLTGAHRKAEDHERGLRTKVADPDLTGPAANDTGRSVDEVAVDLEDATRNLQAATEAVGAAKHTLAEARRAAEAVAAGTSATAAALNDAGIACEVLGDAVEVAPDHQATWDAVLAPWSETLVVTEDNLDAATVAAPPGTVLTATTDSALPEGIETAPPGAHGLLTALAVHTANGTSATVSHPPHVVVGGWDSPRTGRQARIDAAAAAVDRAQSHVADAEQVRSDLAASVRDLRDEKKAVDAAARLAHLRDQVAEAATATADASAAVEEARPAWQSLVDDEEQAKRDLAEQTTRRDEADKALAEKRELLRLSVTEPVDAHNRTITRLALPQRLRLVDTIVAADLEPTVDGFDPHRPDREHSDRISAVLQDHFDTWVAVDPDNNQLREDSLRRRASRRLKAALDALGVATDPQSGQVAFGRRPDWDAEQAITAFFTPRADDDGEGEGDALIVLNAARTTREWLEPIVVRETHQRDLEQERLDRATRDVTAAENQHQQVVLTAEAVKGALIDRVAMLFDQIGRQFAARVRAADGVAATLEYELIEPESSRAALRWQAAPAWARQPDGKPVPYDRGSGNTGHVKVKAFQLVLAALKEGPPGRTLLLDELTAGLDEVHIGEVLDMLKRAASDEQLTIMVALQDTAASEAVGYADEMLYLHRPLMSDLLNAPTSIILAGPDEALRHIAADVAGTRSLGWTPLVQDLAAWDGHSPMVPDTIEGLTDG